MAFKCLAFSSDENQIGWLVIMVWSEITQIFNYRNAQGWGSEDRCEIMFISGVRWYLRPLREIEWVQTVLFVAAQNHNVCVLGRKFHWSDAGSFRRRT